MNTIDTQIELCKKYLLAIFSNDEITVNDYYTIWNGKYADTRGISIIFYSDPISGSLNFLKHKNTILFNLEVNENMVISTSFPTNEISEIYYDYFISLIDFYRVNLIEFGKMTSSFSKHKIPIDFQRSNFIEKVLN